ncbi:9768_t:CDS:2 [Rhizophagus irregularis]|nr:9768_t:CDS:2 [Rhizophagus irregularis]
MPIEESPPATSPYNASNFSSQDSFHIDLSSNASLTKGFAFSFLASLEPTA